MPLAHLVFMLLIAFAVSGVCVEDYVYPLQNAAHIKSDTLSLCGGFVLSILTTLQALCASLSKGRP